MFSIFFDLEGLYAIGQPLPRKSDPLAPCAALLRKAVRGSYESGDAAVHMRDTTSCAVQVTRHENDYAKILRAAICDYEVIQAIRLGRRARPTTVSPESFQSGVALRVPDRCEAGLQAELTGDA